ncbi:restriction endonuclease subunit S [Rhodopirellula europaea]|uniref:Type I restriction-modification system, S subunit n=1 Tax=Rhodopirellula europaea SH398 TaxID=1263868 RepID=M5SL45_9BACT|nr:restriction endonuclease subunit S [Rhodopirellula europaea]EMI28467.1 type I restriction-modification system, S subunit [Rhodopirellula europaea SH398]
MSISLAAYESYEPTGSRWLPEIPSQWELLEGKRIFKNRREASREDDDQLAASQQYGVIPQSLMMKMNDAKVMLALQGTSTFRHVEVDDFVISLRSFEGGIEHSAYVGCVSPAYTVLAAQKPIISEYFKFLLKSGPFVAALQSSTDSLRDGKAISYSDFGSLKLPLPPANEQKQIASFLDYETAKIDALIEKQQQLIALLGEKRQAVISHAVTKGLNPDAPMRDSGVEWLGEVPSHWTVAELKRFATVNTGVAKGKNLAGQRTVNVPYLRVANVQDGYLELDEVTQIDILEHELERYRLRPGDVLMNEGGDFDKLGRGDVWEGQIDPCITQNHVFAVRPNEKLLPRWLSRITSSHYAQFYFKTRSKQSTNLASISSTNLMQLPVVVPPLDEQTAILEFIEHSTEKFDRLLGVADDQVDLLQERRTALISAAVTGKIDVRGWKRPSAAPKKETEMEVA